MHEDVEKFLAELDGSLQEGTFVKLVLGNYKGDDSQLQRILARPVQTTRRTRVSVVSRYETKDITKNFEASEAANVIRRLLSEGFRSGHLFTTRNDFQLQLRKRSKARLVVSKPTHSTVTSREHDRKKKTEIDASAYYLKALGITDDSGRVLDRQRDKWRQINKYLEVLASLFDKSSLAARTKIKIVDMGSGKGYLTFACYDYFNNIRGLEATVVGVENRPELVDLCAEISAASEFDRLTFEHGHITNYDVGPTDVLIALHACDTATDDAIFKGIQSAAELIIAAPCCHKEIRRQMVAPPVLKYVLRHGVMLEREAETITDGLRSMLLEACGYTTKVFEFVPLEHTPKNNMVAGTKRQASRDGEAMIKSIESLMEFYGIRTQRLHTLLRP